MTSTTGTPSTAPAPVHYVSDDTLSAACVALGATGNISTYLAAETRSAFRVALRFLAEYQSGSITYADASTRYGWSAGTVKNRLTLGAILARLGDEATEATAKAIQPAARKLAPNLEALTTLLNSTDATGHAWAEHVENAVKEHDAKPKPTRAARPSTGKGSEGTDARTGSTAEATIVPADTAQILAAALREIVLMRKNLDTTDLAARATARKVIDDHSKAIVALSREIRAMGADLKTLREAEEKVSQRKPAPEAKPEPAPKPAPKRTRKPKVTPESIPA